MQAGFPACIPIEMKVIAKIVQEDSQVRTLSYLQTHLHIHAHKYTEINKIA